MSYFNLSEKVAPRHQHVGWCVFFIVSSHSGTICSWYWISHQHHHCWLSSLEWSLVMPQQCRVVGVKLSWLHEVYEGCINIQLELIGCITFVDKSATFVRVSYMHNWRYAHSNRWCYPRVRVIWTPYDDHCLNKSFDATFLLLGYIQLGTCS